MQAGSFFCPGVDGAFLPDYPEQLYEARNVAKVPVLMGFQKTEGNGLMMQAEGFGDGLSKEKSKEVVQGAVMIVGIKVSASMLL